MFALVNRNLLAYCNNDSINLSDEMGYVVAEAATVAAILKVISFCIAAIAIYAVLQRLVSSPSFQKSWANFCSAVGNGLSSFGSSVAAGGQRAWNWSKAQLIAMQTALLLFTTLVTADTKVRTKVQSKKHTYFQVYSIKVNNTLTIAIGSGITQAAVQRLKKGGHVFTMFGYNARKVCALAGNATPMWHPKEKNLPNYYNHYHVSKHINSAHCWYLV